MFHTILTLSYLIPNLYLFVRIWQLFIPKRYRLLYVIAYAVIFSVYPLSNLFDYSNAGAVAQIISAIANYLLPFFLYLFLFVLLTDLLLLVNLLLRIIPREKLRIETFRSRVLLLIICLSALVVIAGIINFNTIRTSEYQVVIPRKFSTLKKLRIAFVSDFHLQENTPVRFVRKFVRKIESIKPDLMLYGGDMVEGDREDEKMEQFENLLKGIKPRYGVYGVLGNHEHYARQDRGIFLSKAGIEILRDTFIVADNSFVVAGRNDSQVRTRKSAGELMRIIPDSFPVILLDHRPTELEQTGKTSANIVFSGHTHDGQLFPINLITRRIYELSHGYMKKAATHFFVSSGIRLWGPPVRTTGKSEIVVVDVTLR
jgi:predicted MPP superfamily phosphohydrolase